MAEDSALVSGAAGSSKSGEEDSAVESAAPGRASENPSTDNAASASATDDLVQEANEVGLALESLL